MFDLTGKAAVVTGGGSGIGRAICQVLGQQGARVCVLEVNRDAGARVCEEIRAAGGRADPYPCDVGDQAAVRAVFERVVADCGRLDVLVNNAGVSHVGTVETTTEEDFERLFRVNVKGVYNCLKAALPYMKAAGGGSIVNLASVAARVGIPDRFAYSMTKGAVLTMTYQVARDYLAHGVRCNSVSPARVHTPFVDGYLRQHYPGREQEMYDRLSRTQPIGRMGRPEEVAALVLYLASEEAAFVTGTDFPIDGGFVNLNT
jgi:NAD(P)-dependent dehydrogenase (short-subunit alcohol dehydrogenase family)